MKFNSKTLRFKILSGFIMLVLITGGSALFIGYFTIYRGILSQAFETVRSDLKTAEYLYYNRLYQNRMAVGYMATLDYLKDAVKNRKYDFLYNKFRDVKDFLGTDIIIVTDSRGNVIQRMNNRDLRGDNLLEILAIKQAIETGKQISGTGILSYEIIKREGEEIAKRVPIKIIPTPKGRKPHKDFETRALVLNTATPVFDNGKLIAVIYGATIKNNNFEIVDRIQNLFFKKGEKGVEIGTVTIFLEDVRISTNVKDSVGERSLGTLVSEDVYRQVFEKGQTWIDLAFVVDRLYIAGYTPLYDTGGHIVGILYVGVPYSNYSWIKSSTFWFIVLIIFITAFSAFFISIYIIKKIIHPINEVVEASEKLAGGDYNVKLGDFDEYELSRMALAFNNMIGAIAQRDEKIKISAESQIAQSEKLASLGRLASGIAHEINNPLTGILTYSSMLKEELVDSEYAADLQVIIDETLRCRKIVRGILDFARESKPEKKLYDINAELEKAIKIIERHVNFRNIKINKNFQENIPQVNVDLNQMKSVFNNLMVNAADAMPGGGELTISTFYSGDGFVTVSFKDTGIGIPEENLNKIFDPFFTTKEPGKGTGLGLSVIYGIIEKHNGTISVRSKVGEGTEFIIKLPAEDSHE